MDKLAITGIGMIDNLGKNPEQCFSNYISDNYVDAYDGKFVADTSDMLRPENMRGSDYASLSRVNQMGLHAAEMAMANIPMRENTFTLFSTLSNGNEELVDFVHDLEDGGRRVKPKRMVQSLKDHLSGLIPILHNFTGGSTAFNSACASSLYALHYAFSLADDYDFIVCGGANSINDLDMEYFGKLGALGTSSKPFDEDRDGFIMGEGAGCVVLERPYSAISRGATIYGYIYKPSLGSDGSAGNIVEPSSIGITKTMQRSAEKYKEALAFVSAHATSTPAGDVIEYDAIKKVVGDVPVTAFKSKLGHTLGACSIIEIIYTLMALRNKTIPKSHNIDETLLNNVVLENSKTTKRFALKNSLGFGGKCASVIIEAV
jgi:3-oxoacyl-[acyl-carrier-protein] synthase II